MKHKLLPIFALSLFACSEPLAPAPDTAETDTALTDTALTDTAEPDTGGGGATPDDAADPLHPPDIPPAEPEVDTPGPAQDTAPTDDTTPEPEEPSFPYTRCDHLGVEGQSFFISPEDGHFSAGVQNPSYRFEIDATPYTNGRPSLAFGTHTLGETPDDRSPSTCALCVQLTRQDGRRYFATEGEIQVITYKPEEQAYKAILRNLILAELAGPDDDRFHPEGKIWCVDALVVSNPEICEGNSDCPDHAPLCNRSTGQCGGCVGQSCVSPDRLFCPPDLQTAFCTDRFFCLDDDAHEPADNLPSGANVLQLGQPTEAKICGDWTEPRMRHEVDHYLVTLPSSGNYRLTLSTDDPLLMLDADLTLDDGQRLSVPFTEGPEGTLNALLSQLPAGELLIAVNAITSHGPIARPYRISIQAE